MMSITTNGQCGCAAAPADHLGVLARGSFEVTVVHVPNRRGWILRMTDADSRTSDVNQQRQFNDQPV